MRRYFSLVAMLFALNYVFGADIEYSIEAGDGSTYTMYFNIVTDEDQNPTENVEVTYAGESGTTGGSYNSSEVEIPGSIEVDGFTYTVTTIGDYAFYNCTNLESVFIPASVTEIGQFAFMSCTSLESVTFEDDSLLKTIGQTAFGMCTSLTQITIPAMVESLGSSAFALCTSLTTVTCLAQTPPTLTGSLVFQSCTVLQNLYVPYCSLDLYKADNGTYGWATTFSEENISTYEEIYEGDSFDEGGVTYEVTSQCDGYTVKISGYTSDLPTELTIPTSVNYSDIDFAVTEVDENAFYNCTSLEVLTIPSTINEIGTNAFSGCSLTSLTINGSTMTTLVPSIFGISSDGCVLYVVEELRADYYDNGWAEYFTIYGYNAIGDTFEVEGIEYEVTDEGQADIIGVTEGDIKIVTVVSYNTENFSVDNVAYGSFVFESDLTVTVSFIDPETIEFIDDETVYTNDYNRVLNVPDGAVSLYEDEQFRWVEIFEISGEECFERDGVYYLFCIQKNKASSSKNTITLEVDHIDEDVTDVTIPRTIDLGDQGEYEVTIIGQNINLQDCKSLSSITLEADVPLENAEALNQVPEACVIIVASDELKDAYSALLPGVKIYTEEEYKEITLSVKNTISERVKVERYNIVGEKITAEEKGINIIRYSDGKIAKVLLK